MNYFVAFVPRRMLYAVTGTTPRTQRGIRPGRLPDVNLTEVKTRYPGVGDRHSPAVGGADRLYPDEVQVARS